jgi:hypothetical protein
MVLSGTPVSSTNKTDRHDITEILLKVALNTINQTKANHLLFQYCWARISVKGVVYKTKILLKVALKTITPTKPNI